MTPLSQLRRQLPFLGEPDNALFIFRLFRNTEKKQADCRFKERWRTLVRRVPQNGEMRCLFFNRSCNTEKKQADCRFKKRWRTLVRRVPQNGEMRCLFFVYVVIRKRNKQIAVLKGDGVRRYVEP